MAILFLIRHGQSAGNAGLPTENHATIPLTEKGKEQAQLLADSWWDEPRYRDYILSSPFTRAMDTAKPTIQRFPDAPVEIDPDLREFTYLSPASCVNTTKEERRPRVDAYWERMDPDYLDAEEAESFSDLVERTSRFLKKVRAYPKKSQIFVFSHMMTITCIKTLIDKPDLDVQERMKIFRSYPFIQNTDYITYNF